MKPKNTFKIIVLSWCSIVCMLLLPQNSYAVLINWHGKNTMMNIGDKVSVFEDPSGKLTFQNVLNDTVQQKFVASTKPNLTLGYTESVFWIKVSIANEESKNLVLEVAQGGLPYCDMIFLNDSGKETTYNSGTNNSFSKRIIKNSFHVFPLIGGTHDYYIRLTTNSGPIPLRLYERNDYDAKSIKQKFVYGMYLGLMLFVFLSNLFFFFSMRNYLYLANALLVIIFTSYSVVVVDTFIAYFFDKLDFLWWYTFIPAFGVTIQVLYCLWFLEAKKYSQSAYKFAIGFCILSLVWLLGKTLLTFAVQQPFNTLHSLLSFFVIGYVGIRVGKKGNRFGYYFAITYIIYFLLVLAEASYINTGNPTYIMGFSYSGYATVLEALALSFLLTQRFEMEKEAAESAKADAQHKLLEKTLENEKIMRDQNVMLESKVEARTLELKLAKEKSEELLLNILPEETANELRTQGKAKTRTYGMVTVLFTDFEGFTTVSEKISPELLVEEIDYCFSAFDNILSKYKIEKIKTVGDAYIAAAGLPTPTFNHAHDAVSAALEFREFIAGRAKEKEALGETPFRIRIGLHTGPVVAGVVGIKKFAYDIWGDTVNIAARMESNSETGKVNISGTTQALVKDKFACEHRGKISAKNKGEIDMYFVERL